MRDPLVKVQILLAVMMPTSWVGPGFGHPKTEKKHHTPQQLIDMGVKPWVKTH